MVALKQFLLTTLSLQFPSLFPIEPQHDQPASKSVAIVGAGSAGLAMLKTILVDLPANLKEDWRIDLFEEREDVGGVWLPNDHEVSAPDIPETPLYNDLHTNTPVPSMSYPQFTFPPGTPLYPRHEHIHAYHRRYAELHNILPSIHFNHRVLNATWVGTSTQGHWELSISNATHPHSIHRADHLIVASGNHHVPRIPKWRGQEAWLTKAPNGGSVGRKERKITHAVYYREPKAFSGKSVLIVGNGASGRDIASQISSFARETYVSVRHPGEEITVPLKPEISHFTQDRIVFVDGSTFDPDVVILATGYELRKPFLTTGGSLLTPSSLPSFSQDQGGELTTNTRYIYPLYRHILSLSPSYPTNALAFIGLPTKIANCPSDIAQSIFAAHAIFNGSVLPPREQLLDELQQYEDWVREHGFDPYKIGHMMLDGKSSDYQDELIEFLEDRGAIPRTTHKFVEAWRRDIFTYQYLKRGWKRIDQLGDGDEWTKDVRTEAEWADLMRRVNEWQKTWERENGIPFKDDLDLAG